MAKLHDEISVRVNVDKESVALANDALSSIVSKLKELDCALKVAKRTIFDIEESIADMHVVNDAEQGQ